MFLIKKITFYIIILTAIAFIIITGIKEYYQLNSNLLINKDNLKYLRENILFISILFSLSFFILSLRAMSKSKRFLRELDKMKELSKSGNFDIHSYLKKLGSFGDKLYKIYHNLEQINRKQALKISSLSGIIKFILNNHDLRIIIIDSIGHILYFSKRFCEDMNISPETLIEHPLSELTEFLNIENILFQLEHSLEYISVDKFILMLNNKKIYNGFALFYPIFNMESHISHIICIFNEKDFMIRFIETEESIEEKAEYKKKENNTTKNNDTGKINKFINFIKNFTK